MPRYHYSTAENGEYLHINVSYSGGDTDLESLLELSSRERILVDLRHVCPNLTELERFYYAATIVTQMEDRFVALVMINPLPSEAQLRTARDRVSAVKTIDEAYKWLGVGEGPVQLH